jgi:hypothetical protein
VITPSSHRAIAGSRHIYNNPLSYVDPTGLEEELALGCEDDNRNTLCLRDLFTADPLESFDFGIFWFGRGSPSEHAAGDLDSVGRSSGGRDSTVSTSQPKGTDQVCQNIGYITCAPMSKDLATAIAHQQGAAAVAAGGVVLVMVGGEIPIVARAFTIALAFDSLSEGLPPGGGVVSKGKILWGSWGDYAKVTVNGQTYAKVGNRLYSEHAVARMQPSGMRFPGGGVDSGSTGGMPQIRQAGGSYDYGRGVAPEYVEAAISTSRGVVQSNGNISHVSGSLEVILNPQGSVVTIITH